MDKTFKKVIASVSAAAIVATQALSAVVYGATNVSTELQSAVDWMIQNQFTSAQNVDQFNPYRTITRAEAAKSNSRNPGVSLWHAFVFSCTFIKAESENSIWSVEQTDKRPLCPPVRITL